jgi:hypothetical protein
MIPESTLSRIVAAIHGEQELYGCMVGFHGNGQSRLLHPGVLPAINYGRVIVIVEETQGNGVTIRAE